MSDKEVRIPHDKIQDPQKITGVTRDAMKHAGLNIHQNEVAKMDDDFKTGERILTIQKKQYFAGMGIGEKTQPGRYIYDPITRKFNKVD